MQYYTIIWSVWGLGNEFTLVILKVKLKNVQRLKGTGNIDNIHGFCLDKYFRYQPGVSPEVGPVEVELEVPRPMKQSTRAWVGLVVGKMVGVMWYVVL